MAPGRLGLVPYEAQVVRTSELRRFCLIRPTHKNCDDALRRGYPPELLVPGQASLVVYLGYVDGALRTTRLSEHVTKAVGIPSATEHGGIVGYMFYGANVLHSYTKNGAIWESQPCNRASFFPLGTEDSEDIIVSPCNTDGVLCITPVYWNGNFGRIDVSALISAVSEVHRAVLPEYVPPRLPYTQCPCVLYAEGASPDVISSTIAYYRSAGALAANVLVNLVFRVRGGEDINFLRIDDAFVVGVARAKRRRYRKAEVDIVVQHAAFHLRNVYAGYCGPRRTIVTTDEIARSRSCICSTVLSCKDGRAEKYVCVPAHIIVIAHSNTSWAKYLIPDASTSMYVWELPW